MRAYGLDLDKKRCTNLVSPLLIRDHGRPVQVVEAGEGAGEDGDDHEGVDRHPYPDEGVSHKLRHLAQHRLLLLTWVPFRRRQP